jgi:hypothetical protein
MVRDMIVDVKLRNFVAVLYVIVLLPTANSKYFKNIVARFMKLKCAMSCLTKARLKSFT